MCKVSVNLMSFMNYLKGWPFLLKQPVSVYYCKLGSFKLQICSNWLLISYHNNYYDVHKIHVAQNDYHDAQVLIHEPSKATSEKIHN